MTPIVLVHGGSFDSRCWEPLLPHLDEPALAVDLPGRGAHPMPLDQVTFAACAEAVAADVDGAGFDEIVLVGHSLAGCSMPATIAHLGDRVRHAVFVAATVPEDGQSSVDTLDPAIQAYVRAAGADYDPGPLDPALAQVVLGPDLDEEQIAWCLERNVPEALPLVLEPVDLSPLRRTFPRTWVRTLRDTIIVPEKQLRFAENVGDCPVVDLDAGHMCMVGQPEGLAAILNPIAARG